MQLADSPWSIMNWIRKIVGTSLATITHREAGKTILHFEQKIRLVEITDMGKRKLEELFNGKEIAVQVKKVSAVLSPAPRQLLAKALDRIS